MADEPPEEQTTIEALNNQLVSRTRTLIHTDEEHKAEAEALLQKYKTAIGSILDRKHKDSQGDIFYLKDKLPADFFQSAQLEAWLPFSGEDKNLNPHIVYKTFTKELLYRAHAMERITVDELNVVTSALDSKKDNPSLEANERDWSEPNFKDDRNYVSNEELFKELFGKVKTTFGDTLDITDLTETTKNELKKSFLPALKSELEKTVKGPLSDFSFKFTKREEDISQAVDTLNHVVKQDKLITPAYAAKILSQSLVNASQQKFRRGGLSIIIHTNEALDKVYKESQARLPAFSKNGRLKEIPQEKTFLNFHRGISDFLDIQIPKDKANIKNPTEQRCMDMMEEAKKRVMKLLKEEETLPSTLVFKERIQDPAHITGYRVIPNRVEHQPHTAADRLADYMPHQTVVNMVSKMLDMADVSEEKKANYRALLEDVKQGLRKEDIELLRCDNPQKIFDKITEKTNLDNYRQRGINVAVTNRLKEIFAYDDVQKLITDWNITPAAEEHILKNYIPSLVSAEVRAEEIDSDKIADKIYSSLVKLHAPLEAIDDGFRDRANQALENFNAEKAAEATRIEAERKATEEAQRKAQEAAKKAREEAAAARRRKPEESGNRPSNNRRTRSSRQSPQNNPPNSSNNTLSWVATVSGVGLGVAAAASADADVKADQKAKQEAAAKGEKSPKSKGISFRTVALTGLGLVAGIWGMYSLLSKNKAAPSVGGGRRN